ncbi:AaceriAGL239Cp [[Ashbya] aceris (nom. inval.)]|nr:AaceriAGL239Cp [[Ashbya] aceris (nom. inval.)]
MFTIGRYLRRRQASYGPLRVQRLSYGRTIGNKLYQLSSRPRHVTRTLWRYFNAPGNVLFVTTNVVALTGMYAYSSLCAHPKSTEIQVLQRGQVERDEAVRIEGSAEQEFAARASAGTLRDGKDFIEEQPWTNYTDIGEWAHVPPVSMESRTMKMSLFYLFYAYYLYRDAGPWPKAPPSNPQANNTNWQQKVGALKRRVARLCGSLGLPEEKPRDSPHAALFYSMWRSEFMGVFSNLNRAQQFHIPKHLRIHSDLYTLSCKLEQNGLQDITEFLEFYRTRHSKEEKDLLQLWFFDFGHHLSFSPKVDTERLYRSLITNWGTDERSFERHMKAFLFADDPRRKLYFRNHIPQGLETASVDTVLKLLSRLNKCQHLDKNDYVIRLISILRKNIYYSESTDSIRVYLPSPKLQELNGSMDLTKRKKALEVLSRDPNTLKILSQLSHSQHP